MTLVTTPADAAVLGLAIVCAAVLGGIVGALWTRRDPGADARLAERLQGYQEGYAACEDDAARDAAWRATQPRNRGSA